MKTALCIVSSLSLSVAMVHSQSTQDRSDLPELAQSPGSRLNRDYEKQWLNG